MMKPFVSMLAIFIVFGVSAIIFVPRLEDLPYSGANGAAGAWSNLWLISTIAAAVLAVCLVYWGTGLLEKKFRKRKSSSKIVKQRLINLKTENY